MFPEKSNPPDRINSSDNLAKFDILVNLEIPLRNLHFSFILKKKQLLKELLLPILLKKYRYAANRLF